MTKIDDKDYGAVDDRSDSYGDELDTWLRSDRSMILPNLRSTAIFGPTTRVSNPHGPDADKHDEPSSIRYKSSNRTLLDSVVWHKRKVAVMAGRAKSRLLGTRDSYNTYPSRK